MCRSASISPLLSCLLFRCKLSRYISPFTGGTGFFPFAFFFSEEGHFPTARDCSSGINGTLVYIMEYNQALRALLSHLLKFDERNQNIPALLCLSTSFYAFGFLSLFFRYFPRLAKVTQNLSPSS